MYITKTCMCACALGVCSVHIAWRSSKRDEGIIMTPWAPVDSSVMKEALSMSMGKQLCEKIVFRPDSDHPTLV